MSSIKKLLEIVKTPLKTKELGFHFLQQIGDQFKDGLLILNNLPFYECGETSFPQQSKKNSCKAFLTCLQFNMSIQWDF